MSEYHKINSVFKRDSVTKKLIINDWSCEEFELLQNCEWDFTEKVDGTNIRINIDECGEIKIDGRTANAQIPSKLLAHLYQLFSGWDKEYLRGIFPSGVILYGEGFGKGIQKVGFNYGDDQRFVLFDVKIGGYWLSRENVFDVGNKLNLPVVPVIGSGSLHSAIEITSGGFTSTWGEFPAEGIVARPKIELLTKTGHRIITKIKHIDFYPS